MFPTQKPPVLPGPNPPGPSASPYPIVVPKHDVTAEYPVDVQVPQRDVPRGDQGLSFISCGKTGEEELASGTQTITCLSWAGSPGATMEWVLPKPPSFLWEARDGESAHRAHGTCVTACAQLL